MITIPKSIKKSFHKNFDEYLRTMGRSITAVLDPYRVDCPNCLWDDTRGRSSNVYDTSFIRPVNTFVGTPVQNKVYPQPFNVETAPAGIQYDPSLSNPKVLRTTLCPVCKGSGVLISDRNVCLKALVTWNPKEEFLDLAAGRDGQNICRIKTFDCNYSLCREAKTFIIDGIECAFEISPRLKGLGGDHIVEFYLIATEVDKSVSEKYDADPRILKDISGSSSAQADVGTPDDPPVIPSDDGPW